MTDAALPNRPSAEVETDKKDHRIPWTVVCLLANTIIAIAVLFRACGPIDFDWKFAEKKAVTDALTASEKTNNDAHAAIKADLATVTTDVGTIKTSIGDINKTIKDEILTRLPAKKAKRP